MNNFSNMLNPQMQQSVQSLFQQAQASRNPQQFLIQKFANNPQFNQGLKIFNEQGIEALNKYISEQFNR